MKSILDLFEEKNFANININEDSKGSLLFNATQIKQWMEPMMSNYCVIFELNCDRTGCGIDDNCTAEQWCIDEEKGYQCSPKSMYYVPTYVILVTIWAKLKKVSQFCYKT